MPNSLDLTHGPWTREDLEEMWESMQAVLPQGRLSGLSGYVPFTDGEGRRWPMCCPPTPGEPVGDLPGPGGHGGPDYFLGTVLHESTATTSP